MPRWFRLVVAVELAGLVVLLILTVRLVASGAHAAGDIVTWARPHAGVVEAPPSLAVPSAPPPPQGVPGLAFPPLGAPFLDRLDRDTGATARGELALVEQLERAIRERLTQAITGAGGASRR